MQDMNDDRSRDRRGDARSDSSKEGVDALHPDPPADDPGAARSERPALGGAGSGRDAALRSDTDRSDVSPASLRGDRPGRNDGGQD